MGREARALLVEAVAPPRSGRSASEIRRVKPESLLFGLDVKQSRDKPPSLERLIQTEQ